MTLKRKLDADSDDVSPVVFISPPIIDVAFSYIRYSQLNN